MPKSKSPTATDAAHAVLNAALNAADAAYADAFAAYARDANGVLLAAAAVAHANAYHAAAYAAYDAYHAAPVPAPVPAPARPRPRPRPRTRRRFDDSEARTLAGMEGGNRALAEFDGLELDTPDGIAFYRHDRW
jgi:hypothetical protein